MDTELKAVLQKAFELQQWIERQQDGLEIKADNAVRVAGALFDLAIEYQAGIAHLCMGRIYGPAFALVRAQFEALVRGSWLRLSATPEELNRFVDSDRLDLKMWQLLAAIESHPNFSDKVLSGIHANVWTSMNSYTHSGMLQVTRRLKAGSIEPSYEPEEVVEVLRAAGFFALVSMNQIAQMAGAHEVVAKVRDLMNGVTQDLSD